MRRTLLIALSVATVLPFVFGIGAPSATSTVYTYANRFAPVGVSSQNFPDSRAPLPKGVKPPASKIVPGPGSAGCSDSSATNVRVNQECTNQSAPGLLGRGESQNETAVAVNPLDPNNVVASQNDYRDGDGHCGVDFSLDGGRTWGSRLAPMTFTVPGFSAPRHYWDAGGDTSVAFDSSGEAYLNCQVFNRGATSDLGGDASAFLLFRSADGGASWSFPASVVTRSDGTGTDGVGLLDKQYMAIDSNPDSPYRDRIYVSWTNYDASFTSAPIYLAYSTDHGNSWTQVGAISGFDTKLCAITTSGAPRGTCDNNQFSDPFIAPNGDVYVAFDNYNNCAGAYGPPCPGDPNDNHNQVLIVKSTDGGNTWSPPVKVADFYDLPDCFDYTGQDFGRACVPTAPLSGTSVFRAANLPSGAALSSSKIVVTFGSYLNQHSNPDLGNCSPAGFSSAFLNDYSGVGNVNGCNNDIVVSTSKNGGANFDGSTRLTWRLPSVNDEGDVLADQWWQWAAPFRGRYAVSYFDRKYGNDQSTGYMDVSMRKTHGAIVRVTDSSMPPSNEFPAANGYSVFMGDYTGLAIGSDGMAHPVWPDTRNPLYTYDPAAGHDPRPLTFAGYGADIYTRSLGA